MSIPPLVCSTPPPPEQCEDDKDPGDFDLSYSLSQEDEDDESNYNFSNFSSFNHYQSEDKPFEIKDQEITTCLDTEKHKEMFIQYDLSKESEQSSSRQQFESDDGIENKLKCEEDMNIEDLNLQLDEETTNVEISDVNEGIDFNSDDLKDNLNIPHNSNINSPDDDTTKSLSYENVIDPAAGIKDTHLALDMSLVEQTNETIIPEGDLSTLKDNDTISAINIKDLTDDFAEKLKSIESVVEDDFEDFDNFQFVNTKNNIASVVESSNPWENNESNESDFGNFTANFQERASITLDSANIEIPMSENIQTCSANVHNNEIDNQVIVEENLDDDFGDFDDFQSSTVKTETNVVYEENACPELPVLNLQSTDNDHHMMESITKVLSSVFIDEITEPDVEFEGTLESLLSETWGHLMETDERQPYIVNWNNSLGQKTLLRALCIDSRNILFGPKWSSHMPKYAANLSVAPLQPQKQVSTPSNVSQSDINSDKATIKPTWSDPFTSDGQESCNTEHETTTTQRPTDLDVFEASLPSKSEKIYSSTIDVQPIRQINLPDTHIFTPTDSEIPRSKTIHYDPGPTVMLPQPVIADVNNTVDSPCTPNVNNVVEHNTEDDNDYWEFQDFKSTSDSSSLPGLTSHSRVFDEKNSQTAVVNVLPKPSVAYQTQLLQPIKVEPSIPTLNWPDPGEVKAGYDDFTDFVTSQSKDKQPCATIETPESEPQPYNVIIKSENSHDLGEKSEEGIAEVLKSENDGFDDEFDTFKSALPSKCPEKDFETITFGSPIIPQSRLADPDYTGPSNNSIKSDSISFTPIQRPNEALAQSVSADLNKSSLPASIPLQTSLLQPLPVTFTAMNPQNQRTTGQILQPLSLESYSQINWPSPGIDLQDLSRFNPVETLQSLKSDLSVSGLSKGASPIHTQKNTVLNQSAEDDVWGEFVSSKPKQQTSLPKKSSAFVEDDEWTDFISSPNLKPQNGLNTISFNVHTNSSLQKTVQNKFSMKNNQTPVEIPTLNYITPKSNPHKNFDDKHFQNL